VLAAVIRGAIAPTLPAERLQRVDVPVLILNGKADAANQKISGLLKVIPTARAVECEGDHHSTPYQPTFQRAVVDFFEKQWWARTVTHREPCSDFAMRPDPD
jgi:pimeloyl-ACP methyl ester carboxylesterase